MKAIRRGNEAALLSLIELHKGMYCRFRFQAYRAGLSNEEADQVVRIAFWKASMGFEGEGRFLTYATWKFRGELISVIREKEKSEKYRQVFIRLGDSEVSVVENQVDETDPLADVDLSDEADQLLSLVSRKDQKMLMMHLCGATLLQSAKRWGMSKAGFKNQIDRIIGQIRKHVHESHDDAAPPEVPATAGVAGAVGETTGPLVGILGLAGGGRLRHPADESGQDRLADDCLYRSGPVGAAGADPDLEPFSFSGRGLAAAV